MEKWTLVDEIKYAEGGDLETTWDFEDIVKLKEQQVKLCNKSRRKIEENGLIDTKKTD
tara:strand:- start:27 stop:200 length:174 start_codon:yes stop_codon:yes gene_type:complete